MQRNRRRCRVLYVVPCTAIIAFLWTIAMSSLQDAEQTLHHHRSRNPLAEDSGIIDCIPSGIDSFPSDFFSQEQRRKGGVLVHVIILIYACAMTAIVCDQYFVPALEAIVERLHLSPDVAGATFMAMGASAPELFSSIAGAFITEDDIGLGTILGSAVFNILCISGIAGVVVWKQGLHIERYPVVRDCIVYGLTVIVLSFIISDNIVVWWEALTLLMIFTMYIVMMHFNSSIEKASKNTVKHLKSFCCCSKSSPDPEKSPLLPETTETSKFVEPQEAEKMAGNGEANTEPPECKAEEDTEDGESDCFCVPVWRVVMWLPSQLFRFTIPPVRFFPFTFVISILWMGALSYVAVWMVTIIGYTIYIPDAVAGLTLLAVGSSIPDLIATVIIAKTGEGNMAISNLLGSNTFDLAFCLGAPWFVKSLISRRGRLLVYSSAMVYTTITLLVILFALLLIFQVTGWRLDRRTGFMCLVLYVLCITLACLYELNVFGPINKPTCF